MNRCVDQQEIALANADCSHKPGSAPRWNYMTNQVDCECELPYSQDLMTGKCVDFLAQQKQDNREFIQEIKRDRQAFDQEMADRRRRDQEQNQQFYNNFMDMIYGPSQTDNRTDHQRGNNANKNNDDSNLCNMVKGIDVLGVWDTNGRWYSCLKGANLTFGTPNQPNGRKPDCPVSNWPPKFQRTRCSSTPGRCTIHFITLESKNYGPLLGYLEKGEEVCGYLY